MCVFESEKRSSLLSLDMKYQRKSAVWIGHLSARSNMGTLTINLMTLVFSLSALKGSVFVGPKQFDLPLSNINRHAEK